MTSIPLLQRAGVHGTHSIVKLDEDKVIGMAADAFKSLKLDPFGYVYVTIDDFWNLPNINPETTQRTTMNHATFCFGKKFTKSATVVSFLETKKPSGNHLAH